MTATDTHTETHAAEGAMDAPQGGDGLYRLVASNDHKMVGRLWIGASLLFLLAIAVLGVATDLERADADAFGIFGSVTKYFQGWVLFRTGIIFMVVMPLFIGIASVIVPLQVGSASIAFPRLAAASFWGWLFAAGVHVASFLADGGLGPSVGTRNEGTLLTIVSLGFMIVALLASSVCIATTVVALRPAGMTLLRVPTFAWSMLVATSVWLFSLPVLLANLIYSYVDLYHWGPSETEEGVAIVRDPIAFGNPDELWASVEWAWSQPQIYAYAIPVLGILGDVVPVAAKQRQANRPVLLSFIGVFGLLSFGAWAQSFLSRGSDPAFQTAANAADRGNYIYDEFLYIAFGIAVFLPVFAAFGGVMDTIRRGSAPKPGAALLGAISGALLLLGATIVGEIRVIPLWDALHIDNVLLSSSTAQLGMIAAASIAASVGALAHWGPKIFGGYVVEPLAVMASLALLGAGLILGVTNLLSAFEGQPDVSVADVGSSLVDTMNIVSVAGMALLALGGLLLIGATIPASRSSEQLPDDPWDGHTLEWACPSPPPVGNFVEPLETITSSEPLLDEFEEVS